MRFGGMSDLPPCKDCPDREVGCHDKCERYKKWKRYTDERREIINKNREEEVSKTRDRIESVGRSKRRKRR